MKPFWKGFTNKDKQHVSAKKYVLALYWDKNNKEILNLVNRVRLQHPTVKIKTIEGTKSSPAITSFPTVLLLKDGKEKARLSGQNVKSPTLLSQLFQEVYK